MSLVMMRMNAKDMISRRRFQMKLVDIAESIYATCRYTSPRGFISFKCANNHVHEGFKTTSTGEDPVFNSQSERVLHLLLEFGYHTLCQWSGLSAFICPEPSVNLVSFLLPLVSDFLFELSSD